MKVDPEIQHRKSTRLKGYDYALPGAYFVTLVTQGHKCLFGEVVEGVANLNHNGMIVENALKDLPNHYPQVRIETFSIMPNHVHAIIEIKEVDSGRGGSQYKGNTAQGVRKTRPYRKTDHGLPEIIRALKSFSARRINLRRNTPGVAVWQRNYYDRIIRNEEEFRRIHLYIIENPRNWAEDEENPGCGFM